MITSEDKGINHALLQKLIQNKCVNPPGDELKSINSIHSFLLEHGIESEIFHVTENRACLLAKLEGSDQNAPQLILGPGHVDVVPVTDPDRWKHDPFGGVIEEGYMYGRGVYDMLYQVSSQVMAFTKMKENKVPLKGNLYLWVVPDEELMGENGTKWFLEKHKEKLNLSEKKTTYALSEGAGAILYNQFNIYGIGQKGPIWKKLIFKGKSAHGSAPWHTDNSLVKASKAVIKFHEHNENLDKNSIDLTYVREIAKIMSKKISSLESLTHEETFAEGIENLYKMDPFSAQALQGITKNTYSPTIIQAGSNPNLIPDRTELTLDIRAMPNVTENQIDQEIKIILGDLAEEVEIESTGQIKNFVQGTASPADSLLFRTAKKIVNDIYPGIDFVPMVFTGATDARFCRLEGIECYELGLSDPKVKLSDIGPAHGTDERMDLSSIEMYLEFLDKLIIEFNK